MHSVAGQLKVWLQLQVNESSTVMLLQQSGQNSWFWGLTVPCGVQGQEQRSHGCTGVTKARVLLLVAILPGVINCGN